MTKRESWRRDVILNVGFVELRRRKRNDESFVGAAAVVPANGRIDVTDHCCGVVTVARIYVAARERCYEIHLGWLSRQGLEAYSWLQ